MMTDVGTSLDTIPCSYWASVLLVEVWVSALKVFILGQDWSTETALELILIQVELFQVAVLVTEWLRTLGARFV